MDEKTPKVGIGVIIRKNNKVLVGKRKSIHGKDTWSFCGGKLEFKETIFECARRETLEESGIKIKNLRIGPVTNDLFKESGKHYVTIFVVADYESGEAKVMEPEKFYEWGWFSWGSLPTPMFLSNKNLVKQGFDPFRN